MKLTVKFKKCRLFTKS